MQEQCSRFCQSVDMQTPRTARAVAREKTTADIIDEGRRQLAEHGAAGLSLRSVARELGMVSSAVYRYVASRDDLLTRLIIEAYDSLGERVEASVASSAGQPPLDRWTQAAHAARDWALARPHEYFLVFGTPVPGYAAPDTTSAAGTRASRALIAIVTQAVADKQLKRGKGLGTADLSNDLIVDFSKLRPSLHDGELLDDDVLLATLAAWTQMFGLLSFELSNQTRGIVVHHRDLFDAAVRLTGAQIGLVGRR